MRRLLPYLAVCVPSFHAAHSLGGFLDRDSLAILFVVGCVAVSIYGVALELRRFYSEAP